MMHAIVLAALSLVDVEQAAVTNAPTVREARARVAERAALLDAAQGLGLPHAFANYAQSPQFGTVGTVEQRLTTAGASIALVDLSGRSPAVAAAQADLRSAQAGELDAERTERIKVVGLFFDAVRTAEIRRLRETIVSSEEADVRAARLRYGAGEAPRLDVLRANVALARAQADLATARADETNALHTLALETAHDALSVQLPGLADLTLREPLRAAPAPDVAIARALELRPEIAAARADVASEQAAIRVAQRAAIPGVAAQVGYTTGTDTGVHVAGPSANLTVDVPLSHSASDRVRAERARLDQADARLDARQRAIQVEVGNAVRSYAASMVATAAAAHARAAAADEVRATEIGYRAGASSSLDLEDARRVYAQAAVDEATALAAQRQAEATLAALMGLQE
jgi:multidrug efflux system outer membrane protein